MKYKYFVTLLLMPFDQFTFNLSIFLEKKTFKIYINLRSAYICMHPNEGVLEGGSAVGVSVGADGTLKQIYHVCQIFDP